MLRKDLASSTSTHVILEQYGSPINIAVRNSIKAKHINIKIKIGLVELVIPKRTSKNEAYLFLQKHELWIRKKLHNIKETSPSIPSNSI